MCSIPLAMAARSVEVNAASIVYGTTPLGQWYLCKVNIITFFSVISLTSIWKGHFWVGGLASPQSQLLQAPSPP